MEESDRHSCRSRPTLLSVVRFAVFARMGLAGDSVLDSQGAGPETKRPDRSRVLFDPCVVEFRFMAVFPRSRDCSNRAERAGRRGVARASPTSLHGGARVSRHAARQLSRPGRRRLPSRGKNGGAGSCGGVLGWRKRCVDRVTRSDANPVVRRHMPATHLKNSRLNVFVRKPFTASPSADGLVGHAKFLGDVG